MMTTLDAPYWLRWARENNEGTYGNDELRDYPRNSIELREKQKARIPEQFRTPKDRGSILEKKKIDIMYKILITGSSGLIGSEVCVHFDSIGWEIHGLDNNQREVFFGSKGDTRWNQQYLRAHRNRLYRTAFLNDFLRFHQAVNCSSRDQIH